MNRRPRVLEEANITLAAVARDIAGVSARAMLQGLIEGETDGQALAESARGRMRRKRDVREHAWVGRMRPHHAFRRTEPLSH